MCKFAHLPIRPFVNSLIRKTAHFRFYSELNDFIPLRKRQIAFPYSFDQGQSVKHLIEALGVPHPEVDLILVNGESVDFSYLVRDGDRVSVYPMFESIDIGPLIRVRPRPLRIPRFVLDIHLGQLAVYLRMMGFDAWYRNDYADAELARISSAERRILLTRDRGLLKRSLVTHGYCLRATDSKQQLVEVLRRFDLLDSIEPFRRCLRCNGLLEPVEKEAILDRLHPRTQQYYQVFQICRTCDRIYWKGSHVQRMERLIHHVGQELANQRTRE